MPDIEKIPVIYDKDYNIRLMGIQKLHPFDTEKYEKVFNHLTKTMRIDKQQFHTPEAVADELLGSVHTEAYLESLHESEAIARVAELGPLRFLPAKLLRKNLLGPMKLATGGTLLGADLALDCGWAVNLSGGYHHAKSGNGEGFCYFADIPLAARHLWEKEPDMKVLVIDLDAHQGNGIEMVLADDPRFFMLDVYNEDIYPNDIKAKTYIDYNLPVSSYTDDEEYLSLVRGGLDWALKEAKPDFIIYNAGTDIFEGDPLGALRVSETGILIRDHEVFERAQAEKIPILMVLSGGYSPKSGGIIGRSLENLMTHILI